MQVLFKEHISIYNQKEIQDNSEINFSMDITIERDEHQKCNTSMKTSGQKNTLAE